MQKPLHDCVGDPVSEGEDDLAGLPLLVNDQHGEEAGHGVQAVEEVVLEGGQAPVVHRDAQTPGQQRDEDGHGERDVAETRGQS